MPGRARIRRWRSRHPRASPRKRKLVWVDREGPRGRAERPPSRASEPEDGPGFGDRRLGQAVLLQVPAGAGRRHVGDHRASRPTQAGEADRRRPRSRSARRTTSKPPPDTPITAGGPIEHVFYVVRENRTYDQILGDDPRGDGDPKLTLFGQDVTPNAHALAQRFPLLDHVYANSEASIDGHFWTSAGAVSDYVIKNWHQNYAGRKRPYDFGVYSVTWPVAGLPLRPGRGAGDLLVQLRRGGCRHGAAQRPRPHRRGERAGRGASSRTPTSGPLAPGPAAGPARALLLQRRLRRRRERDHDAGGLRLVAAGGREPADDREPLRVLQRALRPAAR